MVFFSVCVVVNTAWMMTGLVCRVHPGTEKIEDQREHSEDEEEFDHALDVAQQCDDLVELVF
jgi:hypothetical protein